MLMSTQGHFGLGPQHDLQLGSRAAQVNDDVLDLFQ